MKKLLRVELSNRFLFYFLLLLLVALVIVSLSVGVIDVFSKSISRDQFYFVFFDLRIPRTFALVFVGASLALCGVLLQTLLGNPLSEPFTLGLSGSSTLGAVLFLYFGFSPQWLSLPLGSLVGSFGALALVLFSQRRLSEKSNALILIGVMISFFSGALVTLIISVMTPQEMQQSIYWMMGQVGSPRDVWSYFLSIVFLLVFCFFYLRRNILDKLLLGKDMATSLGVDTSKEKFFVVLLTSILTALSVSISGLVGFVGLVAPHITYRMLKSRRHADSLLVAPVIGALLFLVSDIFSRWISGETEVPAGSLMAILGAPLLVYFLFSSTNKRNSSELF